jgi:hypothetical protein
MVFTGMIGIYCSRVFFVVVVVVVAVLVYCVLLERVVIYINQASLGKGLGKW